MGPDTTVLLMTANLRPKPVSQVTYTERKALNLDLHPRHRTLITSSDMYDVVL